MKTGKVNNILAILIFLVMLGVYLMTAAPTLSFWDCGEFIACSVIMGIPHPPGSPLLSIIGRVMSMIPFYDFRGPGINEIAYRVNMIDILLGALTVMLTYLTMVKIFHRFRQESENRATEFFIMFASAVTAFIAGFSDEFWTNAVETETYMPSIFLSVLSLWLTLKWCEDRNNPSKIRYIFLAAYLIGMGNGVHLTVLLIAPTVFLLVLFTRPEWFKSFSLWFYSAIILAAAGFVKLFTGLEMVYLAMAVFAFFAPFFVHYAYKKTREAWKVTLLGFILCGSLYVIGYSVYPTVMVRADKKPSINEGNPNNWERYKLYMAREQYGQENMYIGMFTRKAEFTYQFGFMYLRYLLQQFPIWGPSIPLTFTNDKSPDSSAPADIKDHVFFSVLLLTVLLYGIYVNIRYDWRIFFALLAFFIVSSIGLVLYINMENPQVRERAYFFLGSFYIIMYWVGFGIYGVIADTLEWLKSRSMFKAANVAAVVMVAIFATLPPTAALSRHIDPGFTNYQVHDRSHDWAPFDYAYNILISCDPDAILFTNGDNDTFPLWYIQEVEGVRKDVRIVNLSLLNTNWYNLQMKHEGHTLPIEYSDDYIENVLSGKDALKSYQLRIWPVDGQTVNAAGLTWNLQPTMRMSLEDGTPVGILRVSDVMVVNIIRWVNWTKPIYFAITVADENKVNLHNYLSMEGMVYKLVKQPGEQQLNVDAMYDNLFKKYQFRSLTDPNVYKQPNTLKLVTNYFICFAQMSERYMAAGNKQKAVETVWGAFNKTPSDCEKRNILYQLLASYNFGDELGQFAEWEKNRRDFNVSLKDRMQFYSILAAAKQQDTLKNMLGWDFSKNGMPKSDEMSFDDRLQLYSMFNFAGDGAKADSLVKKEMVGFLGTSPDMNSRMAFGTKLLQQHLDKQAIVYFEQLLSQDSTNIEVWKAYAASLYASGDYVKAEAAANKLIELAPGDTTAIETRDVILEQIKMKSAASGKEAGVK